MSDESVSAAAQIADGDGARDIKMQILMGVIYRSIAIALFAVFIVIYFPESAFFYPSIGAAAVLYIGSIGSLLIVGKMSRPITYASIIFAVTVFLSMSLPVQDVFKAPAGLEIPVFLTGIIGSVHCLSRAYSEFTGVVTRALLLASAGVLYYSAFTAVDMPVLSQLSLLAVIAFASAAIFSLLGILKRHSNPRVANVGSLFARIESPVVTSVAVAAIMTYVLLIRQTLTDLGAFGLAVLEWAALSGIVLFIFIKIQSTMLDDTAQKSRGVNNANGLYSDKAELEKAAEEVESFVEEGKKGGLVMLMATALIDNDVPADEARPILSIIIDHKDEADPPAMFKWAVGNISEANRKKRMRAVNDMMAAIEPAIDTARDAVKKHNETEPAKAGKRV